MTIKAIEFPSFSILTQAAFWIILFGSILSFSAIVLPWPNAFYRSLLATTCHVINFYFFFSYIIPRFFEKGKFIHTFLGLIILLIIVTPMRLSVDRFFSIAPSAFSVSIETDTRIIFVVFTEIVIAAFASLLRLAVNREQLKLQMSNLGKNQLETELRFLKAQMSPHFLFNSINNIYSLVLLKSEQAPEALLKLSGLLRYLLYECDQKVSIHKEVAALKTYVDLFQLKFEEPLELIWDIQLMDANRYIEPHTLVPLLENALKHSGLGITLNAAVRITIHANEMLLMMRTENNISNHLSSLEKGGIGLGNIRRRLENTFPLRHTLEIKASETWFSLYLEMPLL